MENIFRALTKLRDESAPGTRLAEAVEVTIEILNRSGYRSAFETACEREDRTGPEDIRSAYHTVRMALTPVLATAGKTRVLVAQGRREAAVDLERLIDTAPGWLTKEIAGELRAWATSIREGKT